LANTPRKGGRRIQGYYHNRKASALISVNRPGVLFALVRQRIKAPREPDESLIDDRVPRTFRHPSILDRLVPQFADGETGDGGDSVRILFHAAVWRTSYTVFN
jgi:hypothetical protein